MTEPASANADINASSPTGSNDEPVPEAASHADEATASDPLSDPDGPPADSSSTDTQPEPPVQDAADCLTVEDLDRFGTRTMIAHLTRSYLAENAITPTEILYRADLIEAVEALEYFPKARLPVAIRRCGEEPDHPCTVQESEILLTFLRSCADRRRQELQAEPKDPPDRMDLMDQLSAFQGPKTGEQSILSDPLSQGPGARQRPELTEEQRLLASLCRYLQDCETIPQKIDSMMGLAAGLDPGPGLLVVDRLLGELSQSPTDVGMLLGSDPKPLKLMADLAALHEVQSEEDAPPGDGRSAPAVGFRDLMARAPMEETRDGLAIAILNLLDTAPSLSDAGREADQRNGDTKRSATVIMAELLAITEVLRMLKRDGRFIGGREVAVLMDRRISKLLSPKALGSVLENRTVIEKAKTISEFQQVANVGRANMALGRQLVDLIEDRDFGGALLDDMPKVEERVEGLGQLAGIVKQSRLGDATRARLTERLDDVQYDQMRASKLLSELRKDTLRNLQCFQKVLDYAVDGVFVPGRSQDEAISLLSRHAKRPEFVRSYLAWLRDSGQSGGAIGELGDRLRSAGVPFRDVSEARILVVDDERSAATYMEMVLTDMGIKDISTAVNGKDALRVMDEREEGLDLIICDWMMPVMSGLDFLKQVRSGHPTLPFLMVTALTSEMNVEAANRNAVTAYIAKPFPPEQLEEKVLVLLNKSMGIVHTTLDMIDE